MPCVRAPMLRIKAGEPAGLQQHVELQKDVLIAAPNDRGQHRARVMINRMPSPARVACVADNRPHRIHRRFASRLHVHGARIRVHRVPQGGVD